MKFVTIWFFISLGFSGIDEYLPDYAGSYVHIWMKSKN